MSINSDTISNIRIMPLYRLHINSRDAAWGQPNNFIIRVNITPPPILKPTHEYRVICEWIYAKGHEGFSHIHCTEMQQRYGYHSLTGGSPCIIGCVRDEFWGDNASRDMGYSIDACSILNGNLSFQVKDTSGNLSDLEELQLCLLVYELKK